MTDSTAARRVVSLRKKGNPEVLKGLNEGEKKKGRQSHGCK